VIVAALVVRRRLNAASHVLAVLLGLALAGPAEAALAPPCRLARASLDRVEPLVGGIGTPELLLAQRAIDRNLGSTPQDATEYAVVEVPGWKSEGGAAAMSLVLPGTGQLYTGEKRGYIFLGVEAIALLSYATFSSKSADTRDDYYGFVGDPNDPNSRFSFDRLAGNVSLEEMARLRTVYEKDRAEFYDAVTLQAVYASGWGDPDERYDARALAEDSNQQDHRAEISLYALMANHLVSAIDALHIARLTNIALREDLTLKLKLNPGFSHGSYAFSLIQKF